MDSGVLEAVDPQMWCWLSGGRGCTHVKKGVVRCYVVKGVWRSLLFVCLASNPSMTFPNRVLIESRFLVQPKHIWGFPVDAVVKNPPTSAGDERWGLGTWVGKIPRNGEWQSTAVFLPGKSYRGGAWRAWATSRGLQESDTTEHSTASGRIFEPVLVNACQAYQRMVHEPSIACPLASAAIGPGMGTCPKWTQSSEGKVCITHVG